MRSHHRFIVSAVALGLAACVSLPETQTNPPGAAGDGGTSGVGGSGIAGNGATGGVTTGGVGGASGSGPAGAGGTSGSGVGGSQAGGASGDGGVGGGDAGAAGSGGSGGTTAGAGGKGGTTGGAGGGAMAGVGGTGAGTGGKGGSGGAGAGGKGGSAGAGGAGSGGGAGTGGVAGNGGSAGAAAGSGGTAGGLVELAEGRTATSDSEEVDPADDPPKDNTAAKGNDGDPATRWCAADGMPRYWQVDLGATHLLSRIEIDFEYPAQAIDSAYDYVVAISSDGTTFTPVIDRTDNTDTMTTQTASFPAATSGRHVRVTVTPPVTTPSATWASLWEARIFGQ